MRLRVTSKTIAFMFALMLLFLSTLFLSGCQTRLEADVESVDATPTPPVAISTPHLASPPAPPGSDTATSPRRPTDTVYPEPLVGYVPNPYMGWQDTQRAHKRFAETVGYRRINWNTLNPAEGVYDWDEIESLRANMARQGGVISFRIRTAQPPPWGYGQVMPAWLVEQGAMLVGGHSQVEKVRSTEPLYAGCLFLATHAQFIEALRQQYDGHPDVAFIDIGSYGAYGEWDSEQYDEEAESLDWHARRRIIDMYLGRRGTRPCLEADGHTTPVTYEYVGFQETQLIMPYTPWFADSLVYALTQRQDIGIRHDALGSESHQRRYRDEIGNWVAQRWLHAPIIFEFTTEAHTPEALRLARDFAQEMHASFVHENFSGRGSNQLIEDILTTIGYRLVLQKITYTSELGRGETLSVDMSWQNSGVAPPYYKTYPLLLLLTDSQGRVKLEQQLRPDIRTWLPGKAIPLQGEISVPVNFPAGSYDLRLAFVDPTTQQPVLALAITGRDKQGRYRIGQVNILPSPGRVP